MNDDNRLLMFNMSDVKKIQEMVTNIGNFL